MRVLANHAWQGRRRSSRRRRLLAMGLSLVMTTGCDSLDELLAVDNPGVLVDEDLNDPRLAATLVLSAQNDFECAFGSYVWATGMWADEWEYGGATNNQIPIALRLPRISQLGPSEAATECPAGGVWLPLQRARMLAETAVQRIEAFPAGSIVRADHLIGKARVYEAYSYLLLGEAFCEVTIDGQQPAHSREATWEIARGKFAEALSYAAKVTSGSDAAEARAIQNLALVGRARASLNLGDYAAVRADAALVPPGFVYNATFASTPGRRVNTLVELNQAGDILTVHGSFRDLQVQGVPDPRVRYVEDGMSFTGRLPIFRQLKYASNSAPIRMGSWREAQLMIAEAAGGQVAVDIVNTLRDTHGLPHFSSSDPAEIRATVLEERRRELWLQGHRIGDKLRYDEPWETGLDAHGRAYGDLTCWPLHSYETD